MTIRNFSAQCLIIKRSKIGESDYLLTLLSQERGKFICRANGVRKLHSKKRASLELGQVCTAYFAEGKNVPLLIQVSSNSAYQEIPQSLSHLRQLSLFLEICDKLFVETQLEPEIFSKLLQVHQAIFNQLISTQTIRQKFGEIISSLGYQHPMDSKYHTITEYIGALSEKPIKSYVFLSLGE